MKKMRLNKQSVQPKMSNLKKVGKLSIVGPMILLLLGKSGYAMDQIDFSQLLNSDSNQISLFNFDEGTLAHQVAGDADKLLDCLYDTDRGENKSTMTEKKNFFGSGYSWYNPAKETDADDQPKYKPRTAKESDDFKRAQLNRLLDVYYNNSSFLDVKLSTLNADIKAVQEKIDATQNKDLKARLESLIKLPEQCSNILRAGILQQKLNEVLDELKPSTSDMLVADALKQVQLSVGIAKQNKDQEAIITYDGAFKRLKAINDETEKLKRQSSSIADALIKAENVAKMATRSLKLGQKSNAMIDMYNEVIAQLTKEQASELKLALKEQEQITKTQKLVDELTADDIHPDEAIEVAKEQLAVHEKALKELNNKRVGKSEKDIQKKQDEIYVHQQALTKLTEKSNEAKITNKVVMKKVDELISKHKGDSTKALKEVQAKITSHRGKPIKLDADMLKELQRRVAEDKAFEIENDPVSIAQAQLKSAKAADAPAALEAYVTAVLAKQGIKMENMSSAQRAELATILSKTSSQLVMIINNPRISEATKQQQKQEITKAMIKEVGILVASYSSGASKAALATGDAQTIGMDIALNKMINSLVPTSSINDEFGADMNFDFGMNDPIASAYEVLELQPGANLAQVRAAYKTLAMENHPSKNARNAIAAKKYKEVTDAYNVLMKQ